MEGSWALKQYETREETVNVNAESVNAEKGNEHHLDRKPLTPADRRPERTTRAALPYPRHALAPVRLPLRQFNLSSIKISLEIPTSLAYLSRIITVGSLVPRSYSPIAEDCPLWGGLIFQQSPGNGIQKVILVFG